MFRNGNRVRLQNIAGAFYEPNLDVTVAFTEMTSLGKAHRGKPERVGPVAFGQYGREGVAADRARRSEQRQVP